MKESEKVLAIFGNRCKTDPIMKELYEDLKELDKQKEELNNRSLSKLEDIVFVMCFVGVGIIAFAVLMEKICIN